MLGTLLHGAESHDTSPVPNSPVGTRWVQGKAVISHSNCTNIFCPVCISPRTTTHGFTSKARHVPEETDLAWTQHQYFTSAKVSHGWTKSEQPGRSQAQTDPPLRRVMHMVTPTKGCLNVWISFTSTTSLFIKSRPLSKNLSKWEDQFKEIDTFWSFFFFMLLRLKTCP